MLPELQRTGRQVIHWGLICCFGLALLFGMGCRNNSSQGGSGKRTSWLSRIFHRDPDRGSRAKGQHKKEIEKVIQTARSYRGTPHRDGGVSRLGIDCSALMMLSFESAGLKIPRTARQQAEIGRMIDKRELKPGDLVFFSDRKIGKGITHVGLVTEITAKGEVRFIHTSSKLGVTENLLSTEYFSRTYAKAVRPF